MWGRRGGAVYWIQITLTRIGLWSEVVRNDKIS